MLNDIKPLLYCATVVGCLPHKITGHSFIITKWGIIYDFIMLITAIFFCGFTMNYFLAEYANPKDKLFVGIRRFLYFFCLITDGVFSLSFNNRITKALNILHTYDLSARFHKKNHRAVRNFIRALIIIDIIYWIIVGYFSYFCAIKYHLFDAIMHSFYGLTMSIQVFKFCGVMQLVYRRFNHLSQLVLSKGNLKNEYYS